MSAERNELGDLVGAVAQSGLGYEDLRPGQEEAAAAVLAGHDVLAVMPTGAGKSAIYQIAGTLIPGATVVVSPLIALQHDQVEAIGSDLGGAVEVGRAGRDGEPAVGIVFRSREGGGGRRFFAGTAELPVDLLTTVASAVAAAAEPLPQSSLAAITKSSETRLTVAVDRLRRAGAVTLAGNGDVGWAGRERAVEGYVEAALDEHERYRVTDRTRTEMLERYLDTDGSRWRVILGYFGQPSDEGCGHCDNCRTGAPGPPDTEGDGEFGLGRRVRHATFGTGEVIGVEGDTITVLFSDAGYRTLSLELVRSGGLLTGA